MDPKALSHLDPKARETYDRIMGTATATSTPIDPPTQSPPPAVDGGMGMPAPSIFSTPQDMTAPADPNPIMGNPSVPNENGLSNAMPTTPEQAPAPNPFGSLDNQNTTGVDNASPSIFSSGPSAQDTFSTPPAQTSPPESPSSSFFTNSSPADPTATPESAAMPSFGPVEPPADFTTTPSDPMQAQSADPLSPVTPIAPYDPGETQSAPVIENSSFSQPLPSPSEVQAAVPHETSALLKVLYIVGAVIFFAIYTIFWIKVFNLPFIF